MKGLLESDEDGMKTLTCQLRCVCDTYDKYQELGISKEIFIDTMKFFPRFLQDHKDRHGSYRYVWAWWVVRQISMVEYRIGELEYEMKIENDKPLIDIHIPADADMVCSSWLLAPSLNKALDENSRILQFPKAFNIGSMEVDSLGFMDWVYGSKDIPIEELPEDTSLQRKLKPYLQNNDKIEWTSGKLISNPFCEV